MRYEEVNTEEFDILVIPGGKSSERVRLYEQAMILRNNQMTEKLLFSLFSMLTHGN